MNKSTCKYLSLESICTKGSSNISINKLNDCNGIYPLYGASGFVKDIDFFHQEKPYIGIVKDGAGVGRVSIYPAKSSLVGTMQYIIPSSKCTINYLYHFLCSLNLSKFVSGATIPHIYFKDYGKCLIPIPTIEEQGMIASELDMITEMISKYDEQLKELDKLSQSIFYEMFGDPVENEKGWEVKKFSDLFKLKSGDALSSKAFVDGIIPVYGGNGISGYHNKYNLDGSYIIIGRVGVYCGNVREVSGQFWLTDNAFKLDYTNDKLCSTFTCHLLQALNLRKYANVAAQPVISNTTLKSIDIILPPLPLQQSFARKIEAIEAMKSKVKDAKKEAETLLAARMQYWFE